VSLSFTTFTRVKEHFEEYLSQKSRMNKSCLDFSSARSSSNCSIGMDEGLFEQPEPLASSKGVMEKIVWQRSLQMRDQQQAWQVTFSQIENSSMFSCSVIKLCAFCSLFLYLHLVVYSELNEY